MEQKEKLKKLKKELEKVSDSLKRVRELFFEVIPAGTYISFLKDDFGSVKVPLPIYFGFMQENDEITYVKGVQFLVEKNYITAIQILSEDEKEIEDCEFNPIDLPQDYYEVFSSLLTAYEAGYYSDTPFSLVTEYQAEE